MLWVGIYYNYCNHNWRIFDSSVGAFEFTSLHVVFDILGVEVLIPVHVHLQLLAISIGECISL